MAVLRAALWETEALRVAALWETEALRVAALMEMAMLPEMPRTAVQNLAAPAARRLWPGGRFWTSPSL